uniref:RING1 and YY1 binding protein n=1 Tax=Scleropages formosus TaxID=113540 RepID=A0A8C9TXE1_SCLFO
RRPRRSARRRRSGRRPSGPSVSARAPTGSPPRRKPSRRSCPTRRSQTGRRTSVPRSPKNPAAKRPSECRGPLVALGNGVGGGARPAGETGAANGLAVGYYGTVQYSGACGEPDRCSGRKYCSKTAALSSALVVVLYPQVFLSFFSFNFFSPLSTPLPPRRPKSDIHQSPRSEVNSIQSGNSTAKTNNSHVLRPKLKNIDRSTAQQLAITVGNVTVIITDFKEKTRSSSTSSSTVTSSMGSDQQHQSSGSESIDRSSSRASTPKGHLSAGHDESF